MRREKAAVSGPAVERRAVEEALRLIPDAAAYPVAVIDPESVPDPSAVRQLDAFTVREADGSMRPKIYINSESAVLQQAVGGTVLYRYVLAAIVVHERTHLAGGNEADARRSESDFFNTLVQRNLVDWGDGVRYLELLRQRQLHDHVQR
jgi:hypothetical protein